VLGRHHRRRRRRQSLARGGLAASDLCLEVHHVLCDDAVALHGGVEVEVQRVQLAKQLGVLSLQLAHVLLQVSHVHLLAAARPAGALTVGQHAPHPLCFVDNSSVGIVVTTVVIVVLIRCLVVEKIAARRLLHLPPRSRCRHRRCGRRRPAPPELCIDADDLQRHIFLVEIYVYRYTHSQRVTVSWSSAQKKGVNKSNGIEKIYFAALG